MSKLLDWLDRRNDWLFILVLYSTRWIVLCPLVLISSLLEKIALDPVFEEDFSRSIVEMSPVSLFGYLVVISPLFETILECSLPYAIIALLRRTRRLGPRPIGFIVVSAICMALQHFPIISAIPASLLTGAFLAYCYGHFAQNSHLRAIGFTALFHAAINIVGWIMITFCRATT